MKYFGYKKELNKGYIPSDKVRHNKEPYECFSELHEMLKSIANNYKYNMNCKGVLYDIDTVLSGYLERSSYEVLVKKVKPFYVNINIDGIQLFIHRWNWTKKQ